MPRPLPGRAAVPRAFHGKLEIYCVCLPAQFAAELIFREMQISDQSAACGKEGRNTVCVEPARSGEPHTIWEPADETEPPTVSGSYQPS